jgi:hypothetical protein
MKPDVTNKGHLSNGELEEQLNEALKETFPASDPVSIGEPSGTEADRPIHRQPAKLDTELVNQMAKNVKAKHCST